jgi:hypothetical protein
LENTSLSTTKRWPKNRNTRSSGTPAPFGRNEEDLAGDALDAEAAVDQRLRDGVVTQVRERGHRRGARDLARRRKVGDGHVVGLADVRAQHVVDLPPALDLRRRVRQLGEQQGRQELTAEEVGRRVRRRERVVLQEADDRSGPATSSPGSTSAGACRWRSARAA